MKPDKLRQVPEDLTEDEEGVPVPPIPSMTTDEDAAASSSDHEDRSTDAFDHEESFLRYDDSFIPLAKPENASDLVSCPHPGESVLDDVGTALAFKVLVIASARSCGSIFGS